MSGHRPAFTLAGLLDRATDEDPDRLAVSAVDGELAYGELEERAAKIAAALVELGVRPSDRVAVCASKSLWTVAALHGILRAGAAYVPIDPLAPPSRAHAVLRDAECSAVCADDAGLVRLESAIEGEDPPALSLGNGEAKATLGFEDLAGMDPASPHRGCESDLAYILYTSGSTGAPKGVMLTHRNALAFVEWATERFSVTAEDRLVSHAPFHFDLSVFDLFGSAMATASVHCLAPGEESMAASMAAAVRSHGLTVWYSVPSALVLLCDAASTSDLASLRAVLFAGEVFPIGHLRRLRPLVPAATLANLYGPTETNVCTYFVVDGELPQGDEPLPIGRACENQQVFALDPDQRPVEEGQEGELWVRGPTVMKGYWGRPDLTEERLRQNPLHDLYPDPAYRTGDRVRRLGGGQYAFLGRRDQQVKSRGYRIELGEIEVALASHPEVDEAVAVAVPEDPIGVRIVGFVASSQPLDDLQLKRHCTQSLPRYMIPGAIVIERALPRTSTGKIDRRALADRAAAS